MNITLHCHNWKSSEMSTAYGVKTICGLRRSVSAIADTPQAISCDVCVLRVLREGQVRGLNDDNIMTWTWSDLGAVPPPRLEHR